jgi:Tfp pilus assembly protein PilN
VRRPLNLASRPFRNETLPALLFGLAAVALLALTVQHTLTLAGLRPGRGTPLEQEGARLEAQSARLRAEAGALRVPEPDAKAIPRWTLLKELVDRRALRWTELLSVFERTLPSNVRLVSLAPEVRGGAINLDLMLVARSDGNGLEVLRLLEERPEFDQVYPLSAETRDDGQQVHYSMAYHPPAAPVSPGDPAEEPVEAEPEEDDAALDERGGAEKPEVSR